MATQTPAAVFGLGSYAAASRRLAALAFDADELRVALGLAASRHDASVASPLAVARSLMSLAAAAAGVAAIDAPFLEDADQDGLRAECLAARRDGFSGKIAIAPAQVGIINAAFVDLCGRV
jgi:citrate lyase subunit beta/citryl-CoA lyase